MKCKNCKTILTYDKSSPIPYCVLCGTSMVPDMDDIFAHGMYGIARESRPTQTSMAKTIDAFCADPLPQVTMIEGGTGVGKSFAYLIPILKHGLTRPKSESDEVNRIIISTAKKTLQKQLVEKDIPFLLERMGIKATCTIMKGNADYLCWHVGKIVAKEDKQQYNVLVSKAKATLTPIDKKLWKGTLPTWWGDAHVGNCPGKKQCPIGAGYCKPDQKKADIVVVNHHLLAIDLKVPGHLFGKYKYLVIDEAHQAIEAFRGALTTACNPSRIQRVMRTLARDVTLRDTIDDATRKPTTSQLYKLTKELKVLVEKLHKTATSNQDSCSSVDPKDLQEYTPKIRKITLKFIQLLDSAALHLVPSGNALHLPPTHNAVQFATIARLKKIRGVIKAYDDFTATLNQPQAIILKVSSEKVESIPIDVGTFFQRSIQNVPKCIITSATLTISGSFTHSLTTFGLTSQNTETHLFASPYNLKEQARLYMPIDMPLPALLNTSERKLWVNALAEEITNIARVIRHHLVILFTATSDKNELFEALHQPLLDLGLVPIDQKDNAERALSEYTTTAKPVLFGLKSFWEGVDLPGNKLRCVIIPKLPFPHPKDPIISKLCSLADNAFNEVMIPGMIFDMQQGTGRLIRSAKDKGIVAILDPRAWTGTKNPETHKKRVVSIKQDRCPTTNKLRMGRLGYGKRLLDALGYIVQAKFKTMEKWVKNNLDD